MDPFSLATGIVGLVATALQLVTSALGMIDKTIADHNEVADELKNLQDDLKDLQTQMSRIHTTLKELASNTKDRGFKRMLRKDHGNTALADLCIALDETSVLLKRLTDETKVQEAKMHSLSPPDDTGSLAFVLAVFKHNLAPSKTASLVKSLRDMRSDVQKCLRRLDTAFQHSWTLYTAMSNGLARIATNGTTFSTSTALTARIKLVDWLKDREGTWGMSKQRNGAITIEQVTNRGPIMPNIFVEYPKNNDMFCEVTPVQKRVARVVHTYRAQAAEAIRISHELVGSGSDPTEFCTILAVLEAAIEAAVKAEGLTTIDVFHEFVNCLNDESKSKRMEDAKNKDEQNVTNAAAQSTTLEGVLEKVKNSPLLRPKHRFSVIDPRIDLIMEIPSDARLADIIWKFHRRCGKDTVIRNPHFYPETPFKEEVMTDIPPLRHRDEGKWTERIFVYGDSKEGRIKLTSQDESIVRLFGAVIDCPMRPPPLRVNVFKDIEGFLLAEDEVDLIFSRARDLKCFRWRDSSFVLDHTVRTVRDVANSSKTQNTELQVSFPQSMMSTDLPQEERHSVSGVGVLPGMGPASSTTPFYSDVSPDHGVSIRAASRPRIGRSTPVQDNSPGDSKMVSDSTWNLAASLSVSIAPHHLGSVDPSPHPSYPPPTTQKNHDPPSFATLGAAKTQVPPKEVNPPISPYRGVRLANTAGSSSIPALAAVQPRHDDAPPTHHTQGMTLPISISYWGIPRERTVSSRGLYEFRGP